jgi:hypothetical protein
MIGVSPKLALFLEKRPILMVLLSYFGIGFMLFLFLRCSWDWPDSRIEAIQSEQLEKIEIGSIILANGERSEVMDLYEKEEIDGFLKHLNEAETGNKGRMPGGWHTRVNIKFKNGETLPLYMVKSAYCDCYVEYCPDCIGIKKERIVRKLCRYVEELAESW